MGEGREVLGCQTGLSGIGRSGDSLLLSYLLSARGQSLRFCPIRAASALPPIATKQRTSREVRFVPRGDILVFAPLQIAAVHANYRFLIYAPSMTSRILRASTSISKGFATMCIPLSRWPLPTTAFSA